MTIADDVTDCVIAHYGARFHRNDIRSDTDIKSRFNFSAAAWAAEAEALSNLPCIGGLGVRIAQTLMNANTTPASIGDLVEELVKKKKKAALTKKPGAAASAKKKAKTGKKKQK